jgi:hypothetical protein
VVVLASHLPISAAARFAMEEFRDHARQAIVGTASAADVDTGVPRGIFHRITPEGRRVVWDIALV